MAQAARAALEFLPGATHGTPKVYVALALSETLRQTPAIAAQAEVNAANGAAKYPKRIGGPHMSSAPASMSRPVMWLKKIACFHTWFTPSAARATLTKRAKTKLLCLLFQGRQGWRGKGDCKSPERRCDGLWENGFMEAKLLRRGVRFQEAGSGDHEIRVKNALCVCISSNLAAIHGEILARDP